MALKVGVFPDTGLLLVSFKVMVTVEVAVPLAITGVVPVMDEVEATGVPAVKVTDPSVLTIGVSIFRVLISALSELNVQVEIPLAFVAEQVP